MYKSYLNVQQNNNQSNRTYQLNTETPHYQTSSKNYLNYVNFQNNLPTKNSFKDIPKEPEQVATYSINTNPHPHPNLTNSNSSNPIHRNAYLNSADSQKQPPKQALSRNSSHKDPFSSRQSQELVPTNNEFLKSNSKTSAQGFHRKSSDVEHSSKPLTYVSEQEFNLGSPSCSKTVDLGSIKHQQLDSSLSPEDEEVKQKLNYLEVIEQSLRMFESTRSPSELQQLNQDNRLLMLGVFEEISKLKEDRSRRTISDCISESDNFSEDAYSLDDRSDNRSSSIHKRTDRRKYAEGLSRSREKIKANEKQIEQERRLNQKLKQEYEEELRKLNNNDQSELGKLDGWIQKQDDQIKKIKGLNEEMGSKLSHLPFHNEWKIMCGEADGAKKARVKIEEEIKKRKEKLSDSVKAPPSKTPVRSEETSANQKEQEKKGRESSASKSRIPALNGPKIPPSPINRSQGSQNNPGSNRAIQDGLTSQMGRNNRSRSANRFNTST